MSAYQLPAWVWPVALIGVGSLAIWRGRDMERLAAAAVLANWALTIVVYRSASHDTQWGILLVDLAQFAVLMWVALRSQRYWPLLVAGFGLLQVVTHGAMALDTKISAWAYITAGIIWSYLILLVIAYASWTAPRRYAEIEATPTNDPPGATRR